jgi:hypothetical protein
MEENKKKKEAKKLRKKEGKTKVRCTCVNRYII